MTGENLMSFLGGGQFSQVPQANTRDSAILGTADTK